MPPWAAWILRWRTYQNRKWKDLWKGWVKKIIKILLLGGHCDMYSKISALRWRLRNSKSTQEYYRGSGSFRTCCISKYNQVKDYRGKIGRLESRKGNTSCYVSTIPLGERYLIFLKRYVPLKVSHHFCSKGGTEQLKLDFYLQKGRKN